MNERSKIFLLFGLLGLGGWLWFTESGRKIMSGSSAAISSGAAKLVDLANSTLQLIKSYEGFSPVPYIDAHGKSIGYGHFILPGEVYTTLTEPEAYALLQHDTKQFSQAVKGAVKVPLSQKQFDALVSLAYNIGVTAFRNSTLVKKLNAGDYRGAADQFTVWRMSEGKVNPALEARRAKERALFLEGTSNETA